MTEFNRKLENAYKTLTNEEKRILSYIPTGKENCKSARELEPFTGLTQDRLSDCARRMLDRGYPLIACHDGFYVASSDYEVNEYKEREIRRDIKHAMTIDACNRFLQA